MMCLSNGDERAENVTALGCHCGTWRLHSQLDAQIWPQTVKSEVGSTEELFQGMLDLRSEGKGQEKSPTNWPGFRG